MVRQNFLEDYAQRFVSVWQHSHGTKTCHCQQEIKMGAQIANSHSPAQILGELVGLRCLWLNTGLRRNLSGIMRRRGGQRFRLDNSHKQPTLATLSRSISCNIAFQAHTVVVFGRASHTTLQKPQISRRQVAHVRRNGIQWHTLYSTSLIFHLQLN